MKGNNPSTTTMSSRHGRRFRRRRHHRCSSRCLFCLFLSAALLTVITTAAAAAASSSSSSASASIGFLHCPHPRLICGVTKVRRATKKPTASISSPLFAASSNKSNSNNSKKKGLGGGGRSRSSAGGGFGAGASSSSSNNSKKKKNRASGSSRNRLQDTLDDKPKAKQPKQQQSSSSSSNKPYVKDEQTALLEQLAQQSASTPIGRAVAEFAATTDDNSGSAGGAAVDPFWELMPPLIASRFPAVADAELERVAGFVRHALATATAAASGVPPRPPADWIETEHRPYQELHAYMPGLGPTQPFHDPDQLPLCRSLEQNYETICREYRALLESNQLQDKFQSVTSMNYDSGWQTLVLFYNGHRIPHFPYHLCPVTTRLLETVPLAGRIAGFNRQQPNSGIPTHTDGNNLWLTAQMGIVVPDGEAASIRVGSETRHWQPGKCLLYDTTYEHETYNAHPTQERVVLHVDFFNTLALTGVEIDILRYIYSLREEFMKAEGVAKVGAQIL